MMFKDEDVEKILKSFGYEKIPEEEIEANEQSKCNFDNSEFENYCKYFNLSMEGGFQDISPIIFVTIAEIIGDALSGQMPFNVANAVACFINLVGQIAEAYAVQQAYIEDGPGRFYSPLNKNINSKW